MPRTIRVAVVSLVAVLVSGVPAASAQESRNGPFQRPQYSSLTQVPSDRDSVWDGVLIGAAIGAVVGMYVAPQAYCGSHDTECATIVRVAMGIPAIAGGAGIGAIIDRLHKSSAAAPFADAPSIRFRILF